MNVKLVIVLTVVVLAVLLVYVNYTGMSGLERGRDDLETQLTICQDNLSQCQVRVSELSGEVEELQETIRRLWEEKSLLEEKTRYLEEIKQSLEEQIEELENKRRELELLLHACVSEKTNLTTRFENLKLNLRLCEAQVGEIRSWASELMDQVEGLKELVSILRIQAWRLKNENTRLIEELEEARKQINYLTSRVEELSFTNEKLIRELMYAGKQIKYLSREVDKLKSINNRLTRELEDARNQIEHLGRQLQQLMKIQGKYTTLVNAITYASMWTGIYYNKSSRILFYDKLLRTSTEVIREVVDLEEFTGKPGIRALKAFEYTLRWLSYSHDNYVRYVDLIDNTVDIRREVIMLPNETWENGGGDCEDLALFVYAVLRTTIKPGERVYLIQWLEEDEGHAAVLLVHGEEKKKYYIIDPAGNYFNGVGMFLEITFIDREGNITTLYLNPLDLSREAKNLLFTLLRIRYRYYFDPGEYVIDPTVYYYTDAFNALRNWLRYWGVSENVVIEIHDIGIHKTFTSIKDAVEWLECRREDTIDT